MAMSRVFVVTGSNKGIGKSIVKLLLQDKEEKIVYLTSRNQELGETAVKDLEKEGLKAKYHLLDINDKESVEKLRDYLVEKYGGLDVLVNNAGIAYKAANEASFSEQAEVTNSCNFYGTLEVCQVLFPILKKNARVVNVSSGTSESTYRKLSDELKAKFSKPDLKMQGLKDLIAAFIQAAKDDKVEERGYPKSAYGMSKLAVSFMTQIHQREIDEKENKNILINSCCPGYVDTDMSSHKGPLTVEEGADTPAFLALIPVDDTSPKGTYHKLKNVVPYPPAE